MTLTGKRFVLNIIMEIVRQRNVVLLVNVVLVL